MTMEAESSSAPDVSAAAPERDTEYERLSAADYELKFVAERWRVKPVLRWLQVVCRPDPAFPTGTVFTIYYDTPTLDCLHEKRNSDYLKTKVRLRWYRVGDRVSDIAFLETKSRLGSRREKPRLPLPYQPSWPTSGSLDVPSLRTVSRQLRSAGITVSGDYQPVLLVRYRRHRFIEPLTGLRASLDTEICAPAVSRARRLTPSPLPLPTTVFEFKGPRDGLPESLCPLTTLGFRKSSFSKYSACYDYTLELAG